MQEYKTTILSIVSHLVLAVLTMMTLYAGSAEHAQAQGMCIETYRGSRPSQCLGLSKISCDGIKNCRWSDGARACYGSVVPCEQLRGGAWDCATQFGCAWVDCTSDSHCPGDAYCVNFECEYPECVRSNDCGSGQVCVGSGRSAMCVECANDAHCPGSEVCKGSGRSATCVECTSSSQCPGSELCRDNRCVECSSNSHCGSNSACVNNTCRPAAPVGIAWTGGRYSDSRIGIRCGNGRIRRSNVTVPGDYNGHREMDRRQMLVAMCPAGRVTVSCEGQEARSVIEYFQDRSGDYTVSPRWWYQSFTDVDRRPPYRYTFTLASNDLRERRFACRYDK